MSVYLLDAGLIDPLRGRSASSKLPGTEGLYACPAESLSSPSGLLRHGGRRAVTGRSPKGLGLAPEPVSGWTSQAALDEEGLRTRNAFRARHKRAIEQLAKARKDYVEKLRGR